MGFCVVISPKNVDLFALKHFFATQFSPEAHFYFEGVVTNDGAANDACCLTPEEARTLDSAVFKALIQEEGQWESLEWRALGLMRHLINRVPADRIEGRCDSMQFQIGALSNLPAVRNPYFTRWTHRPACGKCLVLSACKGSCPHLTNESLALCCPNEFVFHAAIFGAVWFRLTGTIMLSALPVTELS